MNDKINGIIKDGKCYVKGNHKGTCLYCAFIGDMSECGRPVYVRCDTEDIDWEFSQELTDKLNGK